MLNISDFNLWRERGHAAEGRTALVTGGASGFGAGIARKFVAEGASVMIADIDAGAAEAMAGVLGAAWVAADVGDDAGVAHMAAQATGALGRVDILVNNAGVTHLPAPLEEVAEADFDRVLAGQRQVGLPDRPAPRAGDEGSGGAG